MSSIGKLRFESHSLGNHSDDNRSPPEGKVWRSVRMCPRFGSLLFFAYTNVPIPFVPTSLPCSYLLLPESPQNEQDLLVTPDNQISYNNG